jgi:RND family efflux transporter MFP subunit
MKKNRAVAPLLALIVLTIPHIPAAARGQPQPSEDPNKTRYELEPSWARSFDGIRVFTTPVQQSEMGFSFPTEVREILVKGGDRIEEGELLIRARDGEAVANMELRKIQAENEKDIEAAQVGLRLREIQLRAAEEAFADGAVSDLERDEAQAQRDRAEIEVRIAREAKKEAEVLYERAIAELDRYRIYAPFDGLVENVEVSVGQSVTETEPVIKVVNIDTLRMRVPTPTRERIERNLKRGDPAWVIMDIPGEKKVYVGEVSEVSPVGDFPSGKTNVFVEVKNMDGAPAGVAAWVRYTEPTGEWAERIVKSMEVGTREGAGETALKTP